ncbi:MAG: ADP-dependent NAD(P)H-hydrate dehydratase / NAD(P)H-hydrate epimerase [Pseudonocardiales bacterium]|nr:ADP-dependent NAD(P)H-hydrate dehydratase / NAD(P)H-hydrate epimerase [Pseudonocardiales bacterium]
MRGVYSVEQIRAAEDALMARLPDGALMARAAAGLAVECAALLGRTYGARIALLVGAGNNGGDALYAGAALARRGASVCALLLDRDRAHAGGLAALRRAGGRVLDADPAALRDADLVIDGIVGIGGRGGLRGAAVDLATAAQGLLTVAVDIPSGVDADTGAAEGDPVHADVTVTFGALKAGLLVGDGRVCSGELRLVDIGLDETLPDARTQVLEAGDVAGLLPTPGPADDKYTRGVTGLVAGSAAYPGAGVLATGAAVCGGAGMVRYAGTAADAIRARYPEAVVQENVPPSELRVQAWVVGPGIGTDGAARSVLADVLSTDVPVIVDADAITLLGDSPELLRGRSAPTVLTPHDREFSRIADGPSADRIGSARAAADALGATVLLKGDATVVAAPDGRAWINRTGTPWLGTAGSGDVLSGLIGSLLASGLDPPLAAAVGAYVHGVAGQLAATDGPPTSVDVLNALRPALRRIAAG